MFKLPVAVGMLLALETFPVALKAVVAGLEESADGIGGNRVALCGEFDGQLGGALAGPTKRTHGIPTGVGFHQFFKDDGELRVFILKGFSATAGTALSHPGRRSACGDRCREFDNPRPNGGWHESGRTCHDTGSAVTELDRLRGSPEPSRLFGERMLEAGVSVTDGFVG